LGHTSLSLATADAVGAVVGQTYDKDILRNFVTPIVVNPGEYIAVTVRFLV
jgi:hypothetical protein